MPTLQIEVTEELQRFLSRSGQPEREAVELLEEARVAEEALSAPARLEALRAAVKIGCDQLDRGEYADFTAEDIMREGRERLAAMKDG